LSTEKNKLNGFAKFELWVFDEIAAWRLSPFDGVLLVYINNALHSMRRQSELYKKWGKVRAKRSILTLIELNLIKRIDECGGVFYECLGVKTTIDKGSKQTLQGVKTNPPRGQNNHCPAEKIDSFTNENTVLNPVDNSRKNLKRTFKEREKESTHISLPRADDSDALDALKLINLWNSETAGFLPKLNQLHLGRDSIDKINEQILITPDLQTWKDVFGKLKKSEWARKTQINFLWTMKPISRDKTLQGMYDNAPSHGGRVFKKLTAENPDDKL
jgi:hypothetical protein